MYIKCIGFLCRKFDLKFKNLKTESKPNKTKKKKKSI